MLQSYRNQAIDLQCKSSDWFLYVQCNIGLTWVKDQDTREISVFEPIMTEVRIIQTLVTDVLNKSMDWFLYDREFRHERVYERKVSSSR